MAFRQTVNLGNSIIGVSILTMPYCFKNCGILLSIFLIILSGFLNRAGCHLLLKSAIITRKRSYELMAYDVFGSKGKLVVEIGILGFLIGTIVAFFVVIGDLGPAIISEIFGIPNGPLLRAFIMTFLGMFVALPLGLLRRIDSLSSFSALSLGLYILLITKLFSEAFTNLVTATEKELSNKINWWNWSGALTNLPIFAMALSCQTQLFEVFDYTVLNFEDFNSLRKLNGVVKQAIHLCSFVYIMVGILGYVAFYEDPFQGNILVFLPEGFSSSLTKLGFIFTVVISLPICLFPCRTSLHSLMFRKGSNSLLNEPTSTAMYMSDHDFRLLTVLLIVTTIGISVIVPRIEIVLGLIGSTIGAIICFILPGLIYTNITTKNTTERLMARVVTWIGFFILIVCTISTLHNAQSVQSTNNMIEHIKDEALKNNKVDPLNFNQGNSNRIKSKADVKVSAVTEKAQVNQAVKFPLPLDPIKIKKQEEILQRLENQQKEHKKILEEQKEILKEMKKHEDDHHAAIVNSAEGKDSHQAVIPEKPIEHQNDHHPPDVVKAEDFKVLKPAVQEKAQAKSKVDGQPKQLNSNLSLNSVKNDKLPLKEANREIVSNISGSKARKVIKISPLVIEEPAKAVNDIAKPQINQSNGKSNPLPVVRLVQNASVNEAKPKLLPEKEKLHEPKRDILSVDKLSD
ncbi:putative sodium-coupled neutral amino acid transporter 10 [Halotydeus destructor]|nr:putative sodium-coupled neutral amino acid transporter 10 [Halotydeus destructor]